MPGPYNLWFASVEEVSGDSGEAFNDVANAAGEPDDTVATIAPALIGDAPLETRTKRLRGFSLDIPSDVVTALMSEGVTAVRLIVRGAENFQNSGNFRLTSEDGSDIDAGESAGTPDGGLDNYYTPYLDAANYPLAVLSSGTFKVGVWMEADGNLCETQVDAIGIEVNGTPPPPPPPPPQPPPPRGHYRTDREAMALQLDADIVNIGDSRTEPSNNCVLGGQFFEWDVRHAGVWYQAGAGYSCVGIGQLQFQTTNGMTQDFIPPGEATAQRFASHGSVTNGPFVAGMLVGNHATQGSATKTAYIFFVPSDRAVVVFLPVLLSGGATFSNGETIYQYGGTNPHATLSSVPAAIGSGVTNRHPFAYGERSSPGTGNTVAFGGQFCYQIGMTADYATGLGMFSNLAGDGYGTFRRGHPSLGRQIDTIRVWSVADDSGKHLAPSVHFGFNLGSPITNVQTSLGSAPTAPSATPIITVYETTPINAAGRNEGFFLGHQALSPAGEYDGKCLSLGGFQVFFKGRRGCMFYTIARLNWSITDHLPETVTIDGNVESNTDWKYGDAQLAEFYLKCVKRSGCSRLILRIELGANSASATYEGTLTKLKDSFRAIAQRHIDAATPAGYTEIIVKFVPYWDFSTVSDGGVRNALHWLAARELAEEFDNGVLWDQVFEMQRLGLADPAKPTVLKASLRGGLGTDAGHVNYDGMRALAQAEWGVTKRYVWNTRTRIGGIYDRGMRRR